MMEFSKNEVVIYKSDNTYKVGIIVDIYFVERRAYTKGQGFPPVGEPQGEVFLETLYSVVFDKVSGPFVVEESSLIKVENAEDITVIIEKGATYYEDSDGEIFDKRVKELTIKQIEKLLGYKIKVKGE